MFCCRKTHARNWNWVQYISFNGSGFNVQRGTKTKLYDINFIFALTLSLLQLNINFELNCASARHCEHDKNMFESVWMTSSKGKKWKNKHDKNPIALRKDFGNIFVVCPQMNGWICEFDNSDHSPKLHQKPSHSVPRLFTISWWHFSHATADCWYQYWYIAIRSQSQFANRKLSLRQRQSKDQCFKFKARPWDACVNTECEYTHTLFGA